MIVYGRQLMLFALTREDLIEAIGYLVYLGNRDGYEEPYEFAYLETKDKGKFIRIHNSNLHEGEGMVFNIKRDFHELIERIECEFKYPVEIELDTCEEMGVRMNITPGTDSIEWYYNVFGSHNCSLDFSSNARRFIWDISNTSVKKEKDELEELLEANGIEVPNKAERTRMKSDPNCNPFLTPLRNLDFNDEDSDTAKFLNGLKL